MSRENIKDLEPSIQAEISRDETILDWSAEAKAMEPVAKKYENKNTKVLPEFKSKPGQEEIDLLKGDGQEGYDIEIKKGDDPKLNKEELVEALNIKIKKSVRWSLHDHIKGNRRDMEDMKTVAPSYEGEPVAIDASNMPMGSPNGPDFKKLAKEEYENLVQDKMYNKNILKACRLAKVDEAYVMAQIKEEWKAVQKEYEKSCQVEDNIDLLKGGPGSGQRGHTTIGKKTLSAQESKDVYSTLKQIESGQGPGGSAAYGMAKKLGLVKRNPNGNSYVTKRGKEALKFDFDKSLSEDPNLLKAEKKAGEGSRGGAVIGHTKSGKPIYDSHGHSGHAEYEKRDHTEAMVKHLITLKNIEKNPATKESAAAHKHHKKQFNLHADSSIQLDKVEKDDKKKGKDKTKKSFEEDIDFLKKAKYIKREGGAKHYKYTYKESKMKEKKVPGHGHEDGPLSMTDLHGKEMMNFPAVEKRARSMDDSALKFAINDAKEVLEANPEGNKSGYYQDEIHVYAGELRRREMIREDPKAKTKRIASTILEQLGGNKFIAMTGAKNLTYEYPGILSMRLPRTPKGSYKALNIELMPNDLYKMTFFRMGNAPSFKVEKKVVDGVYNDMLQDIFTKETELHTSLGTMGRKSLQEDIDFVKGECGQSKKTD